MNLYRVVIYEGSFYDRSGLPGYYNGDKAPYPAEALANLCTVVSFEKIDETKIVDETDGRRGLLETQHRHRAKMDNLLLNGYTNESGKEDHHQMIIDMDWKFEQSHHMKYKHDLIKSSIRDCSLTNLMSS